MEDVFRPKKSKENKKMSFFDYLRERPLLVAIKEWFHNLWVSFIEVDSDNYETKNDDSDIKVFTESWDNIEKLEKDQSRNDGRGFVVKYKSGQEVRIGKDTRDKIKKAAPRGMDLEH